MSASSFAAGKSRPITKPNSAFDAHEAGAKQKRRAARQHVLAQKRRVNRLPALQQVLHFAVCCADFVAASSPPSAWMAST